MKVYDISWPITEDMTGYKDKKNVKLSMVKQFENDGVRESVVILSSHTGTHVDAPAHFLKEGKTIDSVALSSLIGKCKVIDFTSITGGITKDHLENIEIEPHSIVLFKTQNSALQPIQNFEKNFIYLDESGAQTLVDRHVKAVGIDYLGIERGQPDHATHTQLMKADITIIEGLRLQNIKAGAYFLCCMPLYTVGMEAAPARAVLIEGI